MTQTTIFPISSAADFPDPSENPRPQVPHPEIEPPMQPGTPPEIFPQKSPGVPTGPDREFDRTPETPEIWPQRSPDISPNQTPIEIPPHHEA